MNTRSTPNSAIWAYCFDGCTISGNTITGTYGYGINVSGGSAAVTNNTVTSAAKGGIYMTLANSYVLGKVDVTTEEYPYDCTVNDNKVTNTPAALLYYNNGTVAQMKGNTFSATTGDAVALSGGAKITNFTNNTVTAAEKVALRVAINSHITNITGNKLTAKGNAMMFTTGSGADNISNNTDIRSSADDAVVFTGQVSVKKMSNNTVKSTTKCGVRAANQTVVTEISGNNITAKDNAVMFASDSSVSKISGNTVTSSSGSGIYITGASAGTVTANTIRNCGASGIGVSSSGKITTVTDNKITGCKDYGVRINNASLTVKMGANTVSGNTPDQIKVNGKIIEPDLSKPVMSAVTNAATGVKVTWAKVAGAEKYRVFRKVGSGGWAQLADTTAVTYTDTTVKSGTKYSYTARCITKDGKTYRSGYDTTGKTVTYVAAPVISKAENTTAGVKITWAKSAGAGKYRVFRKVGSGSWTKIGDASGVTYTDKNVKSGTKYTYTIRCMTADAKSYTSAYRTDGKAITYLSAPVITKLTSAKSKNTVTWGKVAGAAKYRVFIKSGSSWKKLADTTSLSYTHASLKAGTKYTYTVRCISKDGKTATSAYNTTGKSIVCKK